MNLILISIFAFLATLVGGLLALRFKDKLHLVLGFSAGALIGVAFFDLIPESIELAESLGVGTITAYTALGFFVFMIIDRFIMPHHASEEHDQCENEHHRGRLGASSLSFHSLLDGVAIGLAFQVSPAVGLVVAVAVLVHDFSDGINTVGLILRNGGSKKEAAKWLTLDAIAPVVGIIISSFFSFSQTTLGVILALFAGFFLYIGASDLLPESHHRHPTLWTTFTTLLGAGVMFVAIKLAGI
ncbi:MAG: ZIP family metal transporter [Patescibacteria group bacterium]